ncbi:MAG: sigma 54-interacting transcriptional regulator [Bacillota bacterium]|nr:sigma 54-interacting transcriptional regulator [Bacillota bacterium]
MINDNLIHLFRFIDEGVILVDHLGNIVYINESAACIDNIDKETSEGRHILYVYPSLSKKKSTIMKVLRTGKEFENIEKKYRNYKGEEISVISSTYPLYEKNKLVGAAEIFKLKSGNKAKQTDEKLSPVGKTFKTRYDFIDIIGKNKELLDAKERAYKASKTDSPVLIYGETGVGKELFVSSIHNNSNRKDRPLIAENISAIPTSLIEGALFGVSKGSFTGAMDKKGLFEIADGGTLYLDEVSSLPESLQSKLLRVIQEKKVLRVGDEAYRDIDIRIIATFNEEPEKLIAEGKLRKDLYYRLNVVRINIPALRKRKEDIPLFIDYFIDYYNNKFHGEIKKISKEAVDYLISMDYKGNVRELKYIIEGIFNFKKTGIINKEDIINVRPEMLESKVPFCEKIDEYEKKLITEALIKWNYNISKAAIELIMPRQTLQSKIKKYNIT